MNHGLIPGGVRLRTGRQAVFFTFVNPMDNQDGLGEILFDLSQARIASYKNIWKRSKKTECWCNLKLSQQRGLQFFQTMSNAVIFAEFMDKAICMNTKDQLYHKKSVILRPRVVSKLIRNVIHKIYLRSSWESQQDAESYGATEATLLTTEYLYIDLNGETAGYTATQ